MTIETPFNDGWAVRSRLGPFEGLGGATPPYVAVTLPHDAIDVTLWHALRNANQVIVEPLALGVRADDAVGRAIGRNCLRVRGRLCPAWRQLGGLANPRFSSFTRSAHLAYTRAVGISRNI